MNFRFLIESAQAGNLQSIQAILEMYKPLLTKESFLNGNLDEDLYQELCLTLLDCIRLFCI